MSCLQRHRECVDERFHARLAVGAKGLLDIELPKRVAETGVRRFDARLPSRRLFLDAAQLALEEREVLLFEGFGSVGAEAFSSRQRT